MSTRTRRLTMTVPEAAQKLGIGHNQAYQAARSGELPTIRIGNRILVPVSALENKLLSAKGSPDRATAVARSR